MRQTTLLVTLILFCLMGCGGSSDTSSSLEPLIGFWDLHTQSQAEVHSYPDGHAIVHTIALGSLSQLHYPYLITEGGILNEYFEDAAFEYEISWSFDGTLLAISQSRPPFPRDSLPYFIFEDCECSQCLFSDTLTVTIDFSDHAHAGYVASGKYCEFYDTDCGDYEIETVGMTGTFVWR